jgi:FKBP-type peptidyl-prolyl cis-trans isomerase
MNNTQPEVIKTELIEGQGAELQKGQTGLFHYIGTLEDGTEFDSSYKRGEPLEVPVGVGYVIPGWDMGLPGMKVGSKRRLEIPYQLAYGENGIPNLIPPKSTLIFEVELVEILE